MRKTANLPLILQIWIYLFGKTGFGGNKVSKAAMYFDVSIIIQNEEISKVFSAFERFVYTFGLLHSFTVWFFGKIAI